MSLNLLAYALPSISFLKVIAHLSSATYKKFEEMALSEHSDQVKAIVERVLTAQQVQGSEHFERIEDRLKELPDSAGDKTIQMWLRDRLKVVKDGIEGHPIFTTGTDAREGKYYVVIKLDPEMEPAIPWIVTHELSHIFRINGTAVNYPH